MRPECGAGTWIGYTRGAQGGKPAAALAKVRRAKEVACKYVTAMADTDGQRHVYKYKVCGACVRSLLAMGGTPTRMKAAQAGASFCRDTGLTAEAALAVDDEAGGRDDMTTFKQSMWAGNRCTRYQRHRWTRCWRAPRVGGWGDGWSDRQGASRGTEVGKAQD
jgi:hypothetical protein